MKVTSFLLLYLLSLPLFAEPTEEREWRSTAGTTIKASAMSLAGGEVELKSADGRLLKVPLDKLSDEDQAFLNEHFKQEELEAEAGERGKTKGSSVPIVKDGLAQPVGEVSGPIDAGEGSNYFVYVPKTLREGRKAPLMFITGASGGSAGSVKRYIEAAEVNGQIIAASVESRNGDDHPDGNHEHSKRCVAHLLETLPIDENRVYFTGHSGGGAMSFYNAMRITSAGNMPIIGYAPDQEMNTKGYCYAIGGATDYNRYLTAYARAQYGKRGVHRFVSGGHTNGPDSVGCEGITWLNGRYLGDNAKDAALANERQDFEASMIDWIKELQGRAEHRAHYWCDFLLNSYEIKGANVAAVEALLNELQANPNNLRYTDGLVELDNFSDSFYADEGEGGGSKFNHTTSRIEKAAEQLAEELAGVPELEELAKQLGEKTVGK
ncbi:SHD1 domain-containing protein [Haloferula chungangensis]|uniref:SHD1 domain-containing protein n=1 Tax=Haloferula chungangensis TaxID=1048331 RepID=A0ABW2L9X7_9BACT